MKRKIIISPRREQSIKNTIALINEVMATRKKFTLQEFKELSRKYHVRDGILKYAVDRGYCNKVGKRKCYFEFIAGWKPTPRNVAFILDDRADSNYKNYQKRKLKQKKIENQKINLAPTLPKIEKLPKKSTTNNSSTLRLQNKIKELDYKNQMLEEKNKKLQEKIIELEKKKERVHNILIDMTELLIEQKQHELKLVV